MGIVPSKRQLAHVERARRIVRDLLDSLGATTSYATRPPRRREKRPWRAFYGSQLAFTAKKGSVLDAGGKPTQIELVKKFSNSPALSCGSAEPYSWRDKFPYGWPAQTGQITFPTPGSHEFEQLRKEVEELKKLILAAKKFDAATGQPDCEMDDKVFLIKKLGQYLGVDMDSVFK